MGLYDDIRDGLKQALRLNEKVESLNRAVNGLATDFGNLATRVHDIDKRLVRIETMAEMSASGRNRIESKD